MAANTFSIGGIHPQDKKISKSCMVEELPSPPVVHIFLKQHFGNFAKAIVQVGDIVEEGQIIAEPDGFFSSYVHSSVSGKVISIAPHKDLAGIPQMCISIATIEENQENTGSETSGTDCTESRVVENSQAELVTAGESSIKVQTDFIHDKKQIIDKILKYGVVGLGGANFPTHVKLSIPDGKRCDTLIMNACECEPYLTVDYRVLLDKGEKLLVGIAIIKYVLQAKEVIIAIEDNKKDAIEHIKSLVEKFAATYGDEYQNIKVKVLQKKYPEGGEKQIIDAVVAKQVPSGKLPIDLAVVVQNVSTAVAVYEAVQENKALISKVVTFTGDCLGEKKQHNYRVKIGTPLSFVIEYAGGFPEEAVKLISGGPMMGKAVANIDAPTTKSTTALLFLTKEQTGRGQAGPCIRCAKCAEACPMGLEPFLLNKLALHKMIVELEDNAVQDCIECGCCLYTCPANIPLLDVIRQAKHEVINIIKSRK